MNFHNLFWITGRGWVADVELDEKEDFKVGDQVFIGNLMWKVRGVECSRREKGIDREHVGLLLLPIEIAKQKNEEEPEFLKPVEYACYPIPPCDASDRFSKIKDKINELVDVSNILIDFINKNKG